jgi:hypothetical protein
MSLKNRLGNIETDCRDRLHDWLLRIVGLNSTHIHGTPVPVEEPASIPDPSPFATKVK